jgi:hypothetical protein
MAIFGAAPASLLPPAPLDAGAPPPPAAAPPCNGLCKGRTDTPECTLLCLEAWQNR